MPRNMTVRVEQWNYDKHEYEPYKLPNILCTVYSVHMDEDTACARCGDVVKVGDTYTSLTIHLLPMACGYLVCKNCHDLEYNLRINKERENAR